MSISERLDQIEQDAQYAAECWQVGRSKFNTESNAEVIDGALANGESMLAAIRAVLAIDTGGNRSLYGIDFEAGMCKALAIVHQTIAAALGGNHD